jgi:hypothetical protein
MSKSTINAASEVVRTITEALNKYDSEAGIFLDLSKALDSMHTFNIYEI